MKKAIVVVGSANMDLVVRTRRFPSPGETILGGEFATFPGGKGANQAVACAKLGGNVSFLGSVGDDAFGQKLLSGMRAAGVRTDHARCDAVHPTGTAMITVDASGQNEIIVASGSNMALRPADIVRERRLVAGAAVVLLQLETPLDTIIRAAELGRAGGALVILNPAPAQQLPRRLLRLVDVLTPNETELGQLTSRRITSAASAIAGARALLKIGVRSVVVTMGRAGSLLVTNDVQTLFPARRVKAVDTTAAGDAFNGALAVALAEGARLEDSIPFANDVASCSVTRMGAQASMPTLQELGRFRRLHRF